MFKLYKFLLFPDWLFEYKNRVFWLQRALLALTTYIFLTKEAFCMATDCRRQQNNTAGNSYKLSEILMKFVFSRFISRNMLYPEWNGRNLVSRC